VSILTGNQGKSLLNLNSTNNIVSIIDIDFKEIKEKLRELSIKSEMF